MATRKPKTLGEEKYWMPALEAPIGQKTAKVKGYLKDLKDRQLEVRDHGIVAPWYKSERVQAQ